MIEIKGRRIRVRLKGDMGLIKRKRISLRLGEHMVTKRQEGLKEKEKERKNVMDYTKRTRKEKRDE